MSRSPASRRIQPGCSVRGEPTVRVTGPRRARRAARCGGLPTSSNRPNTAEPLPDIAACDRAGASADARRAARSPDDARRPAPRGRCRTRRSGRAVSALPDVASRPGLAASHQPYASFVLTPNAGQHEHDPRRRRIGRAETARSPRSRPSAVPPSRKNGTSAPSARRDRASRPLQSSTRHRRGAARAAPPPRRCCRRRGPACSGIRFARRTRDAARIARGARPPATPLAPRATRGSCDRPDTPDRRTSSANGPAARRETSACRAARCD